MKKITTILLALVCCYSMLAAKELMTLAPSKPKIGDKITVTYNPNHQSAALKEAMEITAQVLVVRQENGGKVFEYPMTKSGSEWKITFTLDEKSARLLLFRFYDGKDLDDNNKNVWSGFVYGKNGKPLRDAQYLRSFLYRFNYYTGFLHDKDLALAQKDLAGELQLYPDNVKAVGTNWDLASQTKRDPVTLKMIKDQLDTHLKKNASSEENVNHLLIWVERVYSKEKADSIRTVWSGKNPKGLIAESWLRGQIIAERDTFKRVELVEKYLSNFPFKEEHGNLFMSVYIRAKMYDRALATLETMKNPIVSAYNSIAWRHIEKGEKLEEAVSWAKKGYDVALRDPKSTKPEYMTMNDWIQQAKYNKSSIGDTYAFGLMKLGKYNDANVVFEDVYAASEGLDEEINTHYVDCLMKSGKNEKAMETAFASVAKGMAGGQLTEMYKAAYTTVKGSIEGFDSVYALAKNEAVKELKAKLKKEIVDRPSIDFELKSIDGSIVKLSDLKGKVVVLDFWATWCGPCLASFPTLQKVYDKYKENPNVKILTLNTWERVKPEDREQHVKNFMEKNKYTFPVLFDTDVVSRYEVEGIPTKFIIDQNGRVRFKDVGFGGAQEMEEKMNLQFEMLLSGDLSLSGQ
ncbi:MAG: redoxin domain-containing protein [Ignavibacteriales bacterium]|nr:redoxin domain-containing protein [Ignavibacteriales bacterium]